MKIRRTATRASVAGLVSIGLVVAAQAALQTSASADPAPQAGDIVGVGSDIIQTSVNFLADGDVWGHPGYNAAGNVNRIFNFDATADANGRNAFTDPIGTSEALNPTVTLRAGTSPVQRPNGGSTGLAAIKNDAGSTHLIDFARSPNRTAGNNLYFVQFGLDTDTIARWNGTGADTSNVPDLISAQTLDKIYFTQSSASARLIDWRQVQGSPVYDPSWAWDVVGTSITATGTAAPIIPIRPQNGAGMLSIFQAPLNTAHGSTGTFAPNVVQAQQNNPATFSSLPAADRKNAVVPFPKGRYNVLTAGYFKEPSTAWNSSTPPATISPALELLATTGTAADGQPTFKADIAYNVGIRPSDVNSTTAWQPGGTLNWAKTLFVDPDGEGPGLPFVNTAPGKALIAAAGVTPTYHDYGVIP